MTHEHPDPGLKALFTDTGQELPAGDFIDSVMVNVDGMKRRALIGRLAIGLALCLLAIVLQDTIFPASRILFLPLIEIQNNLVAEALAPINSLGGLLTIGLLGLRAAHKKLFL